MDPFCGSWVNHDAMADMIRIIELLDIHLVWLFGMLAFHMFIGKYEGVLRCGRIRVGNSVSQLIEHRRIIVFEIARSVMYRMKRIRRARRGESRKNRSVVK